ncbi:MAG: hypothetical protein OEZ65_14600 [Gemmatimonadota bacterium]|nr:hypothetical protein [Gemmatimonadota bacterium]MDH5760815.1 hypothetical protein [Gemmatimonadota bacterium]
MPDDGRAAGRDCWPDDPDERGAALGRLPDWGRELACGRLPLSGRELAWGRLPEDAGLLRDGRDGAAAGLRSPDDGRVTVAGRSFPRGREDVAGVRSVVGRSAVGRRPSEDLGVAADGRVRSDGARVADEGRSRAPDALNDGRSGVRADAPRGEAFVRSDGSLAVSDGLRGFLTAPALAPSLPVRATRDPPDTDDGSLVRALPRACTLVTRGGVVRTSGVAVAGRLVAVRVVAVRAPSLYVGAQRE